MGSIGDARVCVPPPQSGLYASKLLSIVDGPIRELGSLLFLLLIIPLTQSVHSPAIHFLFSRSHPAPPPTDDFPNDYWRPFMNESSE